MRIGQSQNVTIVTLSNDAAARVLRKAERADCAALVKPLRPKCPPWWTPLPEATSLASSHPASPGFRHYSAPPVHFRPPCRTPNFHPMAAVVESLPTDEKVAIATQPPAWQPTKAVPVAKCLPWETTELKRRNRPTVPAWYIASAQCVHNCGHRTPKPATVQDGFGRKVSPIGDIRAQNLNECTQRPPHGTWSRRAPVPKCHMHATPLKRSGGWPKQRAPLLLGAPEVQNVNHG